MTMVWALQVIDPDDLQILDIQNGIGEESEHEIKLKKTKKEKTKSKKNKTS